MALRARLEPEALIGSPDAFIWYVAALEPDDARSWLLYAADKLPAAEWIEGCVSVALVMQGEQAARLEGIAEDLAKRIVAQPRVEGLHTGLRALLDASALHVAAPVVGAWLAERATAGDAALLADWLTHREVSLPPEVRLALELALLERGSAELRRAERLSLAARIVKDVDREKPESRELALRVLLHNEQVRFEASRSGEDTLGVGRLGVADAVLLAIVERALERGGDGSLATDVVGMLGWQRAAAAWRTANLPRVREELARRLADNAEAIATLTLYGVFTALFESEVELPRLRSPRAIHEAIQFALALQPHGFTTPTALEKLDRWAQTAAESWFDVHGLCRGDLEGLSPLARVSAGRPEDMLSNPDLHRAVRAALEPRLARDVSGVRDQARAILQAHPDDTAAIVPAVRSLPVRAIQLSSVDGEVSLHELIFELERIFVQHPWPRAVAGIDVRALLADTRLIELAALEEGRQYEIAAGALRLHRPSIAEIVRGATGDAALAQAALYVAHEIVHGAQGLAHKDVVTALRATGGETALMHIDLAADHAAAMIVHHARPTWALEWLKDLHGPGNRKFPVGADHIEAARARKIGRMLGSRVDYLIRRHGVVEKERLGDGYAFVEMGPAGGTIVILASGPPMSVLGQTALSAQDATLLMRAADRHAPTLAKIDEVLLRLARIACTSSEPT